MEKQAQSLAMYEGINGIAISWHCCANEKLSAWRLRRNHWLGLDDISCKKHLDQLAWQHAHSWSKLIDLQVEMSAVTKGNSSERYLV